jgi:hypothetical protein
MGAKVQSSAREAYSRQDLGDWARFWSAVNQNECVRHLTHD